MHTDDLDTPSLTLDLDILEKNIADLAESCRRHDIPVRVHTKTHKIPEIAHMQLRAGAAGIVCQKVGEAEEMVAAGIQDILIPFNIVGRQKVDRLVRLATRATMTVAVDSETTTRGLSEGAAGRGNLRVYIELDTGGKRCGVQTPQAALDLARVIRKLPGLTLQGIMTFPSRAEAKPFLDETRDLFAKAGIPVHTVSGGGTGTEAVSKEIGCNEVRIGSYAFEGMKRIGRGNPPNAVTCVERMIVTVVSTPTPHRIIIDAGMKCFASYPPNPYGCVVEHPEAKIYSMSVEHGHVDVSGCSHTFTVGERLSVVPQHQGMTTNLHDEVYAVRKGIVEAVWRVAGRGKYR